MIENNKGFTLVEMIGIIILLTVIMLVVAPAMISTLKSTNTKRFNSFKDNLKIAVENYIVDNNKLSDNEVSITFKELLENNYIDEILSIPSDDPLAEDWNTELTGDSFVIATKVTKGYTYQLCKSESICGDI